MRESEVDTKISFWSMRPYPDSSEGRAWEDGARQGWQWAREWHPMEYAPTDRQILVRRHNDCFWEYHVVWWSAEDEQYPWRTDYTAYPTDRLDGWRDIGSERGDANSAASLLKKEPAGETDSSPQSSRVQAVGE